MPRLIRRLGTGSAPLKERARHACSVKPGAYASGTGGKIQPARAAGDSRSQNAFVFPISDENPCARFAGLLVSLLLNLGLLPRALGFTPRRLPYSAPTLPDTFISVCAAGSLATEIGARQTSVLIRQVPVLSSRQ